MMDQQVVVTRHCWVTRRYYVHPIRNDQHDTTNKQICVKNNKVFVIKEILFYLKIHHIVFLQGTLESPSIVK